MPQTLQITDGTTTLDFTGSDYKLLSDGGWAPKRAQRRVSPLGGRSIYEDVEEQLYIQVSGSSASDTWNKYDDLSNLLDQAERWGRDENVSAVLIKYSPSGSSTDVQAVITGPPRSGSFLQQPSNADYTANTNNKIGLSGSPIVLRFTRRGLWLSTASESKSSSASSGNPEIVTAATYTTAADVPSPVDIAIQFNSTGISEPLYIYLAASDKANKLKVLEAEDGVAGNAQSQSVSGYMFSNGNVLILNTTSMSVGYQIIGDYATSVFDSFNSTVRSIDLYAAVRQRDSAHTFMLRARLEQQSKSIGTDYIDETRPVVIDRGDLDRQIINLGRLNFRQSLSTYGLILQSSGIAISTTSTADSLEIDYIGIVSGDDNTQLVKILGDDYSFSVQGTGIVKIDTKHLMDSQVQPEITATDDAITFHYGYEGSPIFSSIGSTTNVLLFGLGRGGNHTYQLTDKTSVIDATSIFTLTADRTLAFLTPQ